MFWIREIAGWSLILFAIILMQTGLQYLSNLDRPKVVEAGVIIIAALGVLRAGVLLIRISTAARISQANQRSQQR